MKYNTDADIKRKLILTVRFWPDLLTPIELRILQRRYVERWSQKIVAKRYGISVKRLRLIEKAGLFKVKTCYIHSTRAEPYAKNNTTRPVPHRHLRTQRRNGQRTGTY